MIEVPVYVPAPQGAGREQRIGQALADGVAPGSAIVGRPDPDPDLLPDMIVVYFEGNIYGAANIVTFADRAMHAYERMRDRYPTAAMMAVPVGQLQRVATLYPQYGRVEPLDGVALWSLGRWLGLEAEVLKAIPDEAFRRELAASGLRSAS